jgi:hypothetical protein
MHESVPGGAEDGRIVTFLIRDQWLSTFQTAAQYAKIGLTD